ncbi:MAG: ribonuclease III [Actinobacteria bacterium]|uniref:ribonuclease III n=1 Tax=freshwater metagenome TaxID=449393 RepID=A0A6J6J534_9ZZZZ|nr:ribonuclease III [Actinomycetota bacterium]
MNLAALGKSLGVEIEPQLLELALTHRSYSYENGRGPNNERLEFLGDAILGFLVTAHIHDHFSDLDEGELTKLKNAVVSAPALAKAAHSLDLGAHLLLGKGEIQTGGREKQNLLADCFEAVLGAAYVSNGMDAASKIVTKFILPMLSNPEAVLDSADPKTTLLELLQAANRSQPVYEITHEGPDHDRTFFATLSVDGEVLSTADGRSRKLAETNAAIKALASFK